MDGGCQVPIAGFAQMVGEKELTLTALVTSPDGKTVYKEVLTGTNPVELGEQAAELLTERGAKKLIDSLKDENIIDA